MFKQQQNVFCILINLEIRNYLNTFENTNTFSMFLRISCSTQVLFPSMDNDLNRIV